MARRTVALLYSFAMGYCRGTLRGIADHAASRGDWDLVAIPPERATRDLQAVHPDGIIAHLFDRRLARVAQRQRVPLVSTCGLFALPGVPQVIADDRMVGRRAAEHLLANGLRSFAFVGQRGSDAARRRADGARTVLAEHGLDLPVWQVPPCRAFDPHGTNPMLSAATLTWIRRLPRPLGVACASDILARQLLDLLRGAGLAVPDEIAVIGVDDDDLLCRLSRPALSSVQLDSETIGRTAAGLLEDLMAGRRQPARETLLPPRQVVARASTDRNAGTDPDLVAALQLDRPVRDVLPRLPVSRRTLERRSRQRFGRGLAAERRARRIAVAQRLLGTTAMPIGDVARLAGFANHPQFVRTFRQATGMTPSAWRR